MHGFYIDKVKKDMRFDVVVTFDVDHSEAVKIIINDIKKAFPDYQVSINADIDVSE